MKPIHAIASLVLILAVVGGAVGLALWKRATILAAANADQPEQVSTVSFATVRSEDYVRRSSIIGTVRAPRSVTLRNELSGTVAKVSMEPGTIVEEGAVLVELDTAVERADLLAREANAELTLTRLRRTERAAETRAASEIDLERARAEHRVALADIARAQAVIDRKTVRAPFRARVGLTDVHVGQYLPAGTLLTSLEGVGEALEVDFSVPQALTESGAVAVGTVVEVVSSTADEALAEVIAIDSRVDARTRNTRVRAKFTAHHSPPLPGSSVRVRVPIGAPIRCAAIPVEALRRGPQGDYVFVVEPGQSGGQRAFQRAVEVAGLKSGTMLIASGLEEGELVAAAGSFKLRDGALVSEPLPMGPPPDASGESNGGEPDHDESPDQSTDTRPSGTHDDASAPPERDSR
jgi:RND family efflux transporter MFP subunit